MGTPLKTRSNGASMTPGHRPPRATLTPSRKNATPRVFENLQGEEGIQVAIRMRPLKPDEQRRVWQVLPQYSSVAQLSKETGETLPDRVQNRNFFTFDHTIGEEASNAQVYDTVAKNIVNSFVDGLNGTIFCYGQTSSGKTFTMQGSGSIEEGSLHENGGLLHFAAHDLFQHISKTPQREYLVRASFLEIYNEEVRDLLSNKPLQIREDPKRGVFVQAEEEVVTDLNGLLKVLFAGEKTRHFASTAMNERSSRSHTIFRITVESSEGDDGAVRISTLNLVDLAGSESVRHTGATGDRQKEGGMINQSLLTLSRVIVALGTPNQTHINFRDSKLTRILQPSLSGNARMAVICCATPSELYLEETRSTLQFASRAKLVKTHAQVNEVLDDRSLIRRLQQELAEARKFGGDHGHVKALQQQATSAADAAKEAEEKLKRLQASILNSSVLFGDARDASLTHAALMRKRRLSDGNFKLGELTPEKAAEQVQPKTIPRPFKKSKVHAAKKISAGKELSLHRHALSTKAETIKSMAAQIQDQSQSLAEKTSEMQSIEGEKENLVSSHDSLQKKVSEYEAIIEELTQQLDESEKRYKSDIAKKDRQIEGSKRKLKQELDDRRVLEETLDQLGETNISDQKKHKEEFEQQVKKYEDLGVQLTLIMEEKNKISSEKDSVLSELDSMRDAYALLEKGKENLTLQCECQASLLETRTRNLQRAGMERDELTRSLHRVLLSIGTRDDRIKGLVEDVASLQHEKVGLQEEKQKLEEQLGDERQSNSSLIEQVSHLNATLSEVEQDRERLSSEINSVKGDLHRANVELSVARETLDLRLRELAGTYDELKQTIDESDSAFIRSTKLGAEFVQLSEKIGITEIEHRKLQETLAETEEERNRVIDCWEKTKTHLEESQQRIIELSTTIERLEASNQEYTGRITELQSAVETENTSHDETKKSLESKIADYETNILENQQLLQESKAEAENLSRDLESAKERIVELESHLEEIPQLQHQLEVSAQQAANQRVQITELTENANKAEEEKTALENTIVMHEQEITRLQSVSKDLSETLDQQKVEIERLQIELVAVQESKTKLDAELVSLNEFKDRLADESKSTADQLEALVSSKAEIVTALEAAKAKIVSLEEEKRSIESQRSELSTKAEELDSQLREAVSEVERVRSELSSVNENSSKGKQELEARFASLELEKEALTEQIASVSSMLESKTNESEELLTALSQAKEDCKQKTDELLHLHDMLENTNSKLKEAIKQKNDAEDELESKLSMLERTISSLEEEKKEVSDKLAKALEKIEELKDVDQYPEYQSQVKENTELKQLLISSNESIEETRAQALELDDELNRVKSRLKETEANFERATLRLNEKALSSESSDGKVQSLLNQLAQKDSDLQRIREEYRAKEEVYQQHQEEKRTLINDAEDTMKSYRKEIDDLRASLKQSESEAYMARENTESLRDEVADKERSITTLKTKIVDLEAENARVKGKLQRSDSVNDSKVISLNAELRKAKAELESKHVQMESLRKQLEKLSAFENEKSKELDEKGDTIVELEKKIVSLERRLSQADQSAKENDNSSALAAEVEQLKKKLESKEKRIQKLNSAKLTREQLDSIKKLKDDYKECQKSLKQAEETVAALKAAQDAPVQPSSVELSKLQFDKDALEKKLRKFASHCQHLEDERSDIANALRSSVGTVTEGDIVKTVVSICDRIATLEEECQALARSDERSSASLREKIEYLESERDSAEDSLKAFRKQNDELSLSCKELEKRLYALESEKGSIEEKLERAKRESLSKVDEKSRTIRFLEQENLQLINDLKATKKALQTVKAERNSLKNGLDDFGQSRMSTPDVTSSRPSSSSKANLPVFPRTNPSSSKKAKESTPQEKENSSNQRVSSSSKRPPLASTRKFPSLDDAYGDTEENTQECKQS